MLTGAKERGPVASATCPCCGYPTKRERAGYGICSICGWEDDGQDDPEFAPYADYFLPDDVAGGPNGDYSLTEARHNFGRFQQKRRPSDMPRFESRNDNRALREALIGIFDSLLPEADAQAYIEVLPEIAAAVERIDRDLSRRLAERRRRGN
ncbi:MAG TPA: CPCC family cysteine-rich protein [Candidatus Baltobacteraceae bacterium]